MKTKNEILKWLRGNKIPLGGLTSHDVEALVTSVNLSNLISYETAPEALFDAYRAIIWEMQPHTRGIAFHAIACELDWSHRYMIWLQAGIKLDDYPKYVCEGHPELNPYVTRGMELGAFLDKGVEIEPR